MEHLIMELLDGKNVSPNEIKEENAIARWLSMQKNEERRVPHLAAVLVGS